MSRYNKKTSVEATNSSFFYRLSINYLTRYNSVVADAAIHSSCDVKGTASLA